MRDEGAGRTEPPELAADASIGLAANVRSAAQARRFITQFCRAADLDADICQAAALLTSELVTNAVIHGRSRATIHVDKPPACLRVAVEDHDPGLPPIGPAPTLTQTSGRGLHIVAALADRWGIERTSTGKAIWFELDHHPGTGDRQPDDSAAYPDPPADQPTTSSPR